MSQPDLLAAKPKEELETVVVKPSFSVYTMMMLLSLFALITACVLLYLELDSYTPKEGEGGSWPWDTKKAVTLRTIPSHDGTSLAYGPATASDFYRA